MFTKKWFEDHGFVKCSWKDIDGETPWVYRFNVYRNNFDIKIDCEIIIYANNNIIIDVYDGSFGRAKFAPWYLNDNTKIVKQIKERIENKVRGMGIDECCIF